MLFALNFEVAVVAVAVEGDFVASGYSVFHLMRLNHWSQWSQVVEADAYVFSCSVANEVVVDLQRI